MTDNPYDLPRTAHLIRLEPGAGKALAKVAKRYGCSVNKLVEQAVYNALLEEGEGEWVPCRRVGGSRVPVVTQYQ